MVKEPDKKTTEVVRDDALKRALSMPPKPHKPHKPPKSGTAKKGGDRTPRSSAKS